LRTRILPTLGDRQLSEIRRSDLQRLVNRLMSTKSLQIGGFLGRKAEGEGFEPSVDRKAHNGFRDGDEQSSVSALQRGFWRLERLGCCTMCCIPLADAPCGGPSR